MLQFPPPVKLTFHHHHNRLDMTLTVAGALTDSISTEMCLVLSRPCRLGVVASRSSKMHAQVNVFLFLVQVRSV